MKNLLARLSLFKDEERVRRAAEYETQLAQMKDSVLKREVAISNNSTCMHCNRVDLPDLY